MAKVTANGKRQKGLTYYTERLRPAVTHDDDARIYYEAWRLRSDGYILTKIIATWPASGKRGDKGTTEHRGGAFRLWKRFKSGEAATPVDLERVLERVKADVVKRA